MNDKLKLILEVCEDIEWRTSKSSESGWSIEGNAIDRATLALTCIARVLIEIANKEQE